MPQAFQPAASKVTCRFGAGNVTRTHDLLITNQLLYRLSYISVFTFGAADLILTNQLLYRLSYTSIKIYEPYPKRLIPLQTRLIISQFSYSVNTFFPPILYALHLVYYGRYFCRVSCKNTSCHLLYPVEFCKNYGKVNR